VSLRHVLIPAGITSATLALLTTFTIDSYFWTSPIWPEWTAFRFNTLEGHSSEWGTSPVYYYFLTCIPKLLLNPLTYTLCIPVALTARSSSRPAAAILLPHLAFIAVYSLLPHKEARFIIYSVPALTAVAASGASHIWIRRHRSRLCALGAIALVASTIAAFAASTALLALSSQNYPGAVALQRLHMRADGERPMVRVHIGNLAAQTGVTRFLQRGTPAGAGEGTVWYYDKTEVGRDGEADSDANVSREFWERFDYVLVEVEEEKRVSGKWEVMDVVNGYAGIGLVREEVGQGIGIQHVDGKGKAQDGLRAKIVQLWQQVEVALKQYITRGWWVKVKMEPKIKTLRKLE